MSVLDIVPDIEDKENGLILPDIKGQLELRDVQFFYQMRPEKIILKGVDLNIKPGQVCALVGKSGGGKSTLMHLILRYYDTKGGAILIDDHDYRTLEPTNLRHNMGLVAQDTQLFNMSIKYNITYGLSPSDYTDEDVIEAAKLANAHDFISEFDDGYDAVVGERGTRLSGGQKQRIALARVFLRKPKILLLDEATSALDAESEYQVQLAIDRLISRRGCTVILVAHRLSTVINSDLIGVVHNGKIVEQGTHDELLQQRGIYAKLVEKQVARMANTLREETTTAIDDIDSLIENIK